VPERLTFCTVGGCQNLAINDSRCATHKETGRKYNRWYGLASWARVRRFKLNHFPICEDCEVKAATDVHHIDGGWKTTGDWRLFIDQGNLKSLCHECHSKITITETRR